MGLTTKEEYIESLRRQKPNVYIAGEKVESVTDFQDERHYIRFLWGNHGIPEPVASLAMLLGGPTRMLYWKRLGGRQRKGE